MNIFKLVQLRSSVPVCQQCAYFQNDPNIIEETYPGLTAMSSGFASVRDQDGLCNYHHLYLSARDNCASFSLCTTERNQKGAVK